MALVAHQPQDLYVTFYLRRLSSNKKLKLKQCLTKHRVIASTDWHCLLKRNICLSVRPPCICVSKPKPLRISGFKGSIQNDDSGTRVKRLKVPKTSVRLEEGGEAQNVPLSFASETNESLVTSHAIHNLFKKWLTMLCTQPPSQVVEILGEPPPSILQETQQGTQRKKKNEVLKMAWSHFLALDATIRIPLLVFVPFYFAVNVRYGAEVSKELTPIWVLGPLIVAIYINIVRGLCAIYAFSFNQTVKVLQNLPSYCILAYDHIFCGKLKDITACLLRPILSIKNRDYKLLTRQKWKELQEWIVDIYLDFVESLWPYYCRTIRFLKRANLI